MKLTPKHAALYMVLGSMFTGGSTVFIKIASDSFSVSVIAAIRFIILGVVFWALTSPKDIKDRREFNKQSVVNAAITVVSIGSWLLAIERLQAITISVALLIVPVLVYFGSVYLLREKPSMRALAGTLVALVGSVMLLGEPLFNEASGVDSDTAGIIYLIVSVFATALLIIQAKKVMIVSSEKAFLGPRSLLVGLTFAAIALSLGEWSTITDGNTESWVYLLLYIFASGIIGNFLYFAGLKRMRAEDSSALQYIEPSTGVLAGIILLGESFTAVGLAGAVVIAIGALIAHPIHVHMTLHFKHPHPPFLPHRDK